MHLQLVVNNAGARTTTTPTSPEWPATAADIVRFIQGEKVLYYCNPLGLSSCSVRKIGKRKVEITSGDSVVLHTIEYDCGDADFFRSLANIDPAPAS